MLHYTFHKVEGQDILKFSIHIFNLIIDFRYLYNVPLIFRAKNALHILRQRCRKVHFLSCNGMGKGQAAGVEGLSGDMFHIRIIEVISDQRVSQILHVDTDLMSAARFQGEGDETVVVSLL